MSYGLPDRLRKQLRRPKVFEIALGFLWGAVLLGCLNGCTGAAGNPSAATERTPREELAFETTKHLAEGIRLSTEGRQSEAVGHYHKAVLRSRTDLQLNIECRLAYAAFLHEWLSTPALKDITVRAILGLWDLQISTIIEIDPTHLEGRRQWTRRKLAMARHDPTTRRQPELWLAFIESADKQFQLDPNDAALCRLRAEAYAQLTLSDRDYFDRTIEAIAVTVGVGKDNSDNYADWAYFLVKQIPTTGRPDTLVGDSNRAISEILNCIGTVTESSRKGKTSPPDVLNKLSMLTPNDVFTLGIQQNPNSILLRLVFSQYLRSAGDPDRAQAQAKAAMAAPDKTAADLVTLARHYMVFVPGRHTERHARAATYLNRARRLDPSLVAVYHNLATVYRYQGKDRRAERMCRKGLSLLESALNGRRVKDLRKHEREQYTYDFVALHAALGQALIPEENATVTEKRRRLAQMEKGLSAISEHIPLVEDRQLVDHGLELQLDVTRMRAGVARMKGDTFKALQLYRIVYDTRSRLDLVAAECLIGLNLLHGN